MRKLSEESKARKGAYDAKYMREHVKQITLGFNTGDPDDMKIYSHIREQPNQTQYLKGLVQDEMTAGE